MNRFCLLIPLIFLSVMLHGQQRALDSLKNLVRSHPAEDSTRLQWLLQLSAGWRNIDPDSGIAVADEAVRLAGTLKDRPRLARAYNNKGMNQEGRGEDSLAIVYYQKSLEIYRLIKDTVGVAIAFHNMGIDAYNLADYGKAVDDHEQSLALFRQTHFDVGIAAALTSLGVTYLALADYPRALDNDFDALKMYGKMADSLDIGVSYCNIGLVYGHLPDTRKALEYQFKSLAISRAVGDVVDEEKVLGNIGNYYNTLQLQDSAIFYYRQSMTVASQRDFQPGVASALVNLAAVYNQLGRFDTARNYGRQALALFKVLGNKTGSADVLNQLGAVSLHSRTGVRQAEDYFRQAVAIGEQTHSLNIESDSWEGLSEALEKQGRYAEALAAYRRYTGIRDSTLNDEKKQAMTRREFQYTFDRQKDSVQAIQHAEEARHAAEVTRQKLVRNVVLTGAAFLLLFAFVAFWLYNRRRTAEFRAGVADTEMKALRAQLNPHFIFNSLNSIGHYMRTHEIDAAERYLAQFGRLMRDILENSEHREISLGRDLEALQLYLEIERTRLRGKFTWSVAVDPTLDAGNVLVPPLLLQPFVENSIWHGIAAKDGPGHIRIAVERLEDQLRLIVEDDGVGLNAGTADSPERRSFGLKITQSRIDILARGRSRVQIQPLSQGTRVEVLLPLSQRF